ncbi:MAG: hypothetical protein ACLGIF_08675 [Actinomycetes bacterium]
MPNVDTVLLPLCVGLTLLGILITALAWRRGNRGRVVQGLGLALAPVALYLSGLLRLLWNGGVALTRWVAEVILSPQVWIGLSLLALSLVLWVVGGFVARRSPSRRRVSARGEQRGEVERRATAPAAAPRTKQAPPVDDDMAEIEALLKARGIE